MLFAWTLLTPSWSHREHLGTRDFENGDPVDKSVTHWIRLIVLGSSNSIPPLVWFSPYAFERKKPEYLVKLGWAEYGVVEQLVDASRCAVTKDMYSVSEQRLLITKYVDGRKDDVCIPSPVESCLFLRAIMSQKSIDWTERKLAALQLLLGGLCE